MMRMLDEGVAERDRVGKGDAGGAIKGAVAPRMSNVPVRPSFPLALGCALVVWAVAAALFFVTYHPGESRIPDSLQSGVYEFELLEDARQGDFGCSALARIHHAGKSYDVRILYEGSERFMARERVTAQASFSDFSEASDMRYAQQGVVASARLDDVTLASDQGPLAFLVGLRKKACAAFDPIEGKGSALLRALTAGDRSNLEEGGLYEDMKALGLAHIVAVSGSHLSVVAALVSALLTRLGCSKRLLSLTLCLFYASYAIFTGLSAPVLRAAVMASVIVLSIWAKRRSHALSALGACVCVLIALHPENALSLSFFLSAASTLGVIVFSPLFSFWMEKLCSGRAHALCDAFALTFAASLPILPATVAVFCRLPLFSPLANLIAAPVFTVFLTGGLLALGMHAVVPAAGSAALAVLACGADAFCAGAEAAARLAWSSIPIAGDMLAVGFAVACVAGLLWVWWPDPSARALRLGLCFALVGGAAYLVAMPYAAKDEVVMLDVGQGDAFLIRSEGASLLVDTGNQEQRLLSALARHGVSSLDGVAISHHDDDHCGCLGVLSANIAGEVLLSSETFDCGCDDCVQLLSAARDAVGGERVRGVTVGDTVRVGKFTCTVVWPYSFEEEGGNADSLCLLVSFDAQADGSPESSVLLTGDAEAAQVRSMMDEACIGAVEVFKAGHHGSKAGVDEGFAERTGAQVVLISAGQGNRYGHPSKEALSEFEGSGAEVFRTDAQGDVTCRFEGDRVSVFAQKP